MSTANMTNKDEVVLPLSDNHIGAIPAIRDIRNECYQHLQQTGFPGVKHEEYRYTPLTRTLEKLDLTHKKTIAGPGITDNAFRLPETDAISFVFVNGVFDAARSSTVTPDGLIIKPLTEAFEEGLGLTHFGRVADYRKDAFVAWNTLTWDNGLYIEAMDNKVINKTIVVYHLTDATTQQVVTVNRNLIVVGKNAGLTIVQKFNSNGTETHYVNTVTEAFVDENSKLDHYSLQDNIRNQIQFNQTQIHQKDSTRVNSYVFTLHGKLVRNNVGFALDGQGCESHMYGLYLLNGDTLADNHTVADHLKPNSFSNELYKGVMDDRSRGVFNGKIYVRPDAQKTNAFQSNRNILLSDDARINTKPQLEIWADDVKCSHGCTTGQLDEEALFYLQSRGIPKARAKAMLLYAFAGELIEAVPLPAVKQHLVEIVRERLLQST